MYPKPDGSLGRWRLSKQTRDHIFLMAFACMMTLIAYLAFHPLITAKAATVRKVYTGGTSSAGDTTYTLSQLQNAIDDAAANDACGSEILLEQNAEFVPAGDGFILRQLAATPTWDCITIRTGVDSAGNVLASNLFPAVGIRMDTSYRSRLANFTPHDNNQPSIRTVYPGETGSTCSSAPCVAKGWTLKWLEFSPKADYPSRALVRFGTNNAGKEFNSGCSCFVNAMPGGDTQDRLVELPQYMTFIQNDIHGDPFKGQLGGLLLACKDARVYSNSFTDFMSRSETQAITGLNGIGPHDVENNLLEASTENTMWGGADTYLIVHATVTGSPTTTSIPMTTPVWYNRIDGSTQTASFSTDIFSGVFIAITHAGTKYTNLLCTFSGSTCTISPALPVTPSVGDLVEWNWLAGGVKYYYNYVLKPHAWINPIMSSPTGVSVKAAGGGTLVGGQYCYRVMSSAFVSVEDVYSASGTEVCATRFGNGGMTVAWNPVANATKYFVHGRTIGGENQFWQVDAPATSFVDSGAAGTAGSPFEIGDASYWLVKNNMEMKHCIGNGPMGICDFQFNVFDGSWCCSQSNLITLKPHNQEALDISAAEINLTFANNWIKHGNEALTLVTTNTGNSPVTGSGGLVDLTIRNNLWTDISSVWWNAAGNASSFDSPKAVVFITDGEYANHVGSRGCTRCSFTHNSFLADSNDVHGPLYFNTKSSADKATDFIFRDNIAGRSCLLSGCDTNNTQFLRTDVADTNQGEGTASWAAATTGSSAADHNVWIDGNSGIYTNPTFPTASSFFPSNSTLTGDLTSYANCVNDTAITNCSLKTSSTYHNAASDGKDIGVVVSEMSAGIAIALSGDMSGTVPTTPTHGIRSRLRYPGGNQQ